MEDREIIKLWRGGLSKNKLATIYKRRYNERIKIIRLEMHSRHAGRYINEYQALNYIEKLILEEVQKKWGL